MQAQSGFASHGKLLCCSPIKLAGVFRVTVAGS